MPATLEGADELIAAFQNIATQMSESIIPEALGDAGAVIANECRSNAPSKSGALRASIQPVVVIVDGVPTVQISCLGYGRFTNYGTKNVPESDWMTDSLQESSGDAMEAIAQKISSELDAKYPPRID